MHLLLTIIILAFVLWKGDWRNLEKYGMTIFYVITCNLLYNVLCRDYLLWRYHPDVFPNNHFIVDLIYSFVNLPSITLLYLSNYPNSAEIPKKLKYVALWVLGSMTMSFIFVKLGRLQLQHGYKLWMDLPFYSVMYSMIKLHQSHKILTYVFSIVVIIFLICAFHVPLK